MVGFPWAHGQPERERPVQQGPTGHGVRAEESFGNATTSATWQQSHAAGPTQAESLSQAGFGGAHAASGGQRPTHNGSQEVYRHSKLFEIKNKDEIPRYDGKSHGGLWRKKVRNFLIARCPDMMEALDRAEASTGPISDADINNSRTSGGIDMAVLDFLLWGLLNGNLKGDAWTTFDAVNGQGGHRGLAVW